MAPRYTVNAWEPGQPKRGPVFSLGTEEVEATVAYAARRFPDHRISVFDNYAGTTEIHRDYNEPLVGGDYDARKFTLDGEPVEIAAFIEDNCFAMPDIEQINGLKAGEIIRYGGGAFAEFILRREV
jgi:hypothetical protein